ncbi:alpha/beta fold hydrolase [Actinomyces minihominis]|uniref:alpha/beta fold hydrolase n=1 Tax=Actinomyces minihominis TaxID=2002838 RepID=UPI001F5E1A49|nr:alpha/beta fold hydrolase [Actinomyces minihominis]
MAETSLRTTSYVQHGCQVHEHRLDVPLDPTGQHYPGRTIEVFARQVIAPGGADRPLLVFLQGGPGGAGPRVGDFRDGWIGEALKDYRVLLLDQRGTGQSTPLSSDVVMVEDDPALFTSLFLQNQIIADAEAFREELADGAKWSTLGQSYGGFLTLGYLSQHPEALRESLFTGGLPGLVNIDDIYRQTYPLTAARNQVYFERYRDDQQVIREVAAHLLDTEEFLPTGERLTPTRMRSIGSMLGGAMNTDLLHYLWEGPFEMRGGRRRLTSRFLAEIGGHLSSALAPLYWVLQEAIYGQTTVAASGHGTRWSAQRLAAEFDGFHLDADPLDLSSPWYLTGEHLFTELIADDPATAALLPVTEALAEKTDWQKTYDLDVLGSIDVPKAALIYDDDMFVPVQLSKQTAALMPNTRTWVTNRMEHDGLRANGSAVFRGLKEILTD